MAFQMSPLSTRVRLIITSSAPLWRSRSVELSVKFRHIPSSAHYSVVGAGKSSARAFLTKCKANIYPGVIIASPVEKFSTASVSKWFQGRDCGSASRGGRGAVCRIAIGFVTLGLTTAAVACLHTSAPVVMATGPEHLKLDSTKVDWKEAKDTLRSMSREERRKHYRSSHLELEKIPVWTPSQMAGKPYFPVNPALDGKISLFSGDITKLEIDGIVNAANKTLLGGGGVDGAIHRVAGPLLRSECAELRGCETGEAKITGGYGLPAKHVIHTVGPIVMGGVREEERSLLGDCYRSSLETATQNQLRTVAFPCISTGVYGYPSEQAVDVALTTVREYLNEHHDQLDRVIFCVFLPKDKDLYEKNLPLYFPGAC